MKLSKSILFAICLLIIGSAAHAQGKFDVNVQAKSMHYWRGLKVTNGFMTGTSAGYFGDKFSAYAWGGLSLDGEYKEVTGILNYKHKDFSATLIDIYNFSGMEKMDYFNYSGGETVHIMDLSLAYNFSFMSVSWSTILYGNDCIDGTDEQRYSTYVEFGFPLELNGTKVTPFVAPAFALNGDAETMLYGDDENFSIANVGFRVNKTVTIGDYDFPVSAEVGVNPALEQASVQLAISLF